MNSQGDLLDIVIVNFNTADHLADCVRSIRKHTLRNSYQIRVVDNASTDDSPRLIRSLPGVKAIFNETNRGYGSACNQGINAGNGQYILLLNSDIRVTPNWLPPLLRVLRSSRQIAVVGPKLVNPKGLIVGAGVVGTNAHPIIRGLGEPNRASRYNRTIECLSVGGACMGIKRELLPELGLFDENYFHYFEETDYCFNARFHGYRVIYCGESQVIHYGHGSCRNSEKLDSYFRSSEMYFKEKWRHFLTDNETTNLLFY
jgi:GT2 family glycosyltransferase